MSTAEDKIAKAKTRLILDQPFFATIALNMPWVEDNSIPTMATDGSCVLWNADFVNKMSVPETVFVAAHEVMHCVLEHCGRLAGKDALRWNYATDYVINSLLVREGVGSMPAGGLLDHALNDKAKGLAETVYTMLPDKPAGEGAGSAGTGGKPLDELRPMKGTPQEQAQAAQQIKVLVAQAAQAARMCGKMSVGMERFVGQVLKSVVPWQDVLRKFVSIRSKVDRTYSRPNRRFLSQDMYMPSLSGETMGELVAAVDCSGSIGPKELNEFAAEISAIHQDVRPSKIHVLYFDSTISHTESYDPGDTLNIRPHGGGGTAFSPIWAKISELGIDPVACVVLTDGYCSDYGHAPSYPVLWCSTDESKFPFGEVTMMKGAM